MSRIDRLAERAAELAEATQAAAMHNLAAQQPAPSVTPPSPRQDAADQDLRLSFARLFHLVTRAGIAETAIAERRRTQDQRDRLNERRATGVTEQARRACSQASVRTLVSNAIAAQTQQAAPALRAALNQRMFDPDIATRFADHSAAAIAAIICRDLAIPLPASAQTPDPAEDPDSAKYMEAEPIRPEPAQPNDDAFAAPGLDDPDIGWTDPELMSSREMDALLRTHPSLDPRPPAASRPP